MEQKSYPSISLCMIARDEEQYIAQAINSVAPIVQEIIVVDTGSQDRTKEIARELGAKVYEQAWEDDFSKPRNYSISLASSDWILILDADEAVAPRDLASIQKATLQPKHCYLLTQRHYGNDQRISGFEFCKGEYPEFEKEYLGFFESSLCRLFPNHEGIEYRGLVHELVEHSISEKAELKLLRFGWPLHHYGHVPEVRNKKKKTKLYTPLGQQKVEDNSEAWKNYFELGVEHNCAGRKEESAAALKRACELNPKFLQAWVNYGYVLTELGRLGEAKSALRKALELNPESTDAHCNFAVCHMRAGELVMAEAHLRKAIDINPGYLNAYSNLGTTLIRQGRIAEGSEIFQKAIKLAPRNGRLLLTFGGVLLGQGLLEEAETIIQEALRIDPKLSVGWYALGDLNISKRNLAEARLAFVEVCRLEELQSETPAANAGLHGAAKQRIQAIEKHLQRSS